MEAEKSVPKGGYKAVVVLKPGVLGLRGLWLVHGEGTISEQAFSAGWRRAG